MREGLEATFGKKIFAEGDRMLRPFVERDVSQHNDKGCGMKLFGNEKECLRCAGTSEEKYPDGDLERNRVHNGLDGSEAKEM